MAITNNEVSMYPAAPCKRPDSCSLKKKYTNSIKNTKKHSHKSGPLCVRALSSLVFPLGVRAL